MERLPQEILQRVCLDAGVKASLTLCKVSKTMDQRVTGDGHLWHKLAVAEFPQIKPICRLPGHHSDPKRALLELICWDKYLDDLLNDTSHDCRHTRQPVDNL